MPSVDRTRFETVFLSDEAGAKKLALLRERFLPAFRAVCTEFSKRNWFPKESGNLSVFSEGAMLVTASGINKAAVFEGDLVLVSKLDPEKKRVWVYGGRKPSSESLMHHLIYEKLPAKAVVHAHAREITESKKLARLRTPAFFEEWTLELARAATAKLAETDGVCVMKDHGVIAYGSTLLEAADRITALLARA
jgi:ribulose-5-phosphate 4-epimerase/fuculose-1-phosphate aldolase